MKKIKSSFWVAVVLGGVLLITSSLAYAAGTTSSTATTTLATSTSAAATSTVKATMVSTSTAATTTATSTATTTVAKPKQPKYPATNKQLTDFLKQRPFYSTTTKAHIIDISSTTTLMDVSSKGLYPVVENRNNQWEEQTSYYNGECDNQWTYIDDLKNLNATYSMDKKGNIKTTISGPNKEFSVIIDGAWVRYDNLKLSGEGTKKQLDELTQLFYQDQKDGYTWYISVRVQPFKSARCAAWVFDRMLWTSRSLGGYAYGYDLYSHVGTQYYEKRGEKNIKNTQTVFWYASSPFLSTNISALEEGVFEDAKGRTAPRTQDFYYGYIKGSNVYRINISTDKPASHKEADQIITPFFK